MTAYDDFRFASADDLADLGGPASRFNHNITAIKLLKSLEVEGRERGDLTSDEQHALARYSGWGDSEALNRLFPYGAYPQMPIHPDLDGSLTIEEREKIASSALNAHYTALPIIGAIYEALDHLGIGALSSLRVLEPAAGIGHFFGAMPRPITAKAERVAIELDSITARILQYLYPNAKVFNQGFEEAMLPNDYFDLILSSTPFGNYAVHDPRIKQRHLKAAIHDYYFARSLRLVKPGGEERLMRSARSFPTSIYFCAPARVNQVTASASARATQASFNRWTRNCAGLKESWRSRSPRKQGLSTGSGKST